MHSDIKEYLDAHRIPSFGLGAVYDTEASAKLASYFKPFISWYEGSCFINGERIVNFEEEMEVFVKG